MTRAPYKVLALRYRPQTFSALVGQETTVTLLQHALREQRLGHALLLTGTRGVGKTTLARLVAKVLNCEAPVAEGGDACDLCSSCTHIHNDCHMDVYEMDAASRTGVDDMREIVETARYRPVMGRYKIFIIDEVHMLSKSAFNSLLKTLEEPPPFVQFILATTEPEKIPDTILSRCQRIDLSPIPLDTLIRHLTHVVSCEGLQADAIAIEHIARAAQGSLRDGLSLLDQALAIGTSHGERIVREELVLQLLGLANPAHVKVLVDQLFAGNTTAVTESVQQLMTAGGHPLAVTRQILQQLHGMMAPDGTTIVTQPAPAVALALQAWHCFSKGYEEIRLHPMPAAAFLMVCLRFCYITTLPSLETMVAAPPTSAAPSAATPVSGAPSTSNTEPARSLATLPSSSTPDAATVAFLEKATREIQAIEALLKQCAAHKEFVKWFETTVQVISLDDTTLHVHFDHVTYPEGRHELLETLERCTGKPWTIVFIDHDNGATLEQRHRIVYNKKMALAKADPLVKLVLHHFPGTIIKLETSK